MVRNSAPPVTLFWCHFLRWRCFPSSMMITLWECRVEPFFLQSFWLPFFSQWMWGLSWPVSIYRNGDLWRYHSNAESHAINIRTYGGSRQYAWWPVCMPWFTQAAGNWTQSAGHIAWQNNLPGQYSRYCRLPLGDRLPLLLDIHVCRLYQKSGHPVCIRCHNFDSLLPYTLTWNTK